MNQLEKLGLQGIIFDMDGVIFDTEALYLNTWSHIGQEMGFTITIEDARVIIGRPPWECEGLFKARYGADFCMAKALRIMEDKVQTVLEESGMPFKPGARELIELLYQKGIPAAIGSSNISRIVNAYLEAAELTEYFAAVVTGDSVEHVKPAPDIFLKAAADLGLHPEECLVIEDSRVGAEAAYAAGCQIALVPDLQAPTAETRACVWRVFGSLNELTAALGLVSHL